MNIDLSGLLCWQVFALLVAVIAAIWVFKRCIVQAGYKDWLQLRPIKILLTLANPGLGAAGGLIPGFLPGNNLSARIVLGTAVGFLSQFIYSAFLKRLKKTIEGR